MNTINNKPVKKEIFSFYDGKIYQQYDAEELYEYLRNEGCSFIFIDEIVKYFRGIDYEKTIKNFNEYYGTSTASFIEAQKSFKNLYAKELEAKGVNEKTIQAYFDSIKDAEHQKSPDMFDRIENCNIISRDILDSVKKFKDFFEFKIHTSIDEIKLNSFINNQYIDYFGIIEIIPNKATNSGYYEGWQTVEFDELSEVVNVQVTACDVKGKSVFESAVVGEVTNTSMQIGVFSKEKLEEPIKVYWTVKGR